MFYPMLVMVLWTLTILLIAFSARWRSVTSGRVKLSSYRLLDRGDLPEFVMKTTRNYANLFELPVLFYAACVTCLALSLSGSWLYYSAWAYVLFRILHSLIHISSNNVKHRLAMFMCSNACLMVLWINVGLAYRQLAG